MINTTLDLSENKTLSEDEQANYFEQQEYMLFIRNKIDSDIGYNYWKNYIVSAFWSNIATPLNLTITFLTAITTAQSQNTGLLTQQIFSNITIINLIITTLITFFRPHEQYSIYSDYVKRWVELGVDLEKEFSTKTSASNNKNIKIYHVQKQKSKIATYKSILDRCVELRKNENNSIINSVTDSIFVIVYYLCMCRLCYGPKKWLDYDRKIHEESLKEFKKKRGKDEPQEDENKIDIEMTPPPSPIHFAKGGLIPISLSPLENIMVYKNNDKEENSQENSQEKKD